MNMESWYYIFNGTPIQSFFYRWLGGEISLSSRLFMRFFIDVDGLVIGEKSILGYDSYLEQHKKTVITLEYRPLNILKNAIVGQRSIILQGASIGNGSQIYPLSAVPPMETNRALQAVSSQICLD
jgi:acetyltransferase-like isoleucine patch superfamily enzyme